MTELTKKTLLDRNQTIIDMVIARAKRDFPEDIALIGLTGSFGTDDFHEKSDLDLIIINNTDRGWEISSCFILDGVGFDIYCTPWEPRIKEQSELISAHASSLVDLKVIYWSSQEDLDKFNAYRNRALELLSESIGENSLSRGRVWLDKAKVDFANLMISDSLNGTRYASACLAENLINAMFAANNKIITRGIKRYREQVRSLGDYPSDWDRLFDALVAADSIREIRGAAEALLISTNCWFATIMEKQGVKKTPTKESVIGIYEEFWCNYSNKIANSIALSDACYSFFAVKGAQEFLDELNREEGMPRRDLMAAFDSKDLSKLKTEYDLALEEYGKVYDKVGQKIKSYHTVEELYRDFMKA